MRRCLSIIAMLSIVATGARADVRVAVAANFAACLDELGALHEAGGGDALIVSVGSTGRHYAQIRAGAPFDVFLAADARRPEMLEAAGLTVAGSRFTYAVGALALWIPEPPSPLPESLAAALAWDGILHLAIANPRLAPYGEAATAALDELAPAQAFDGRLVLGQSVGQAFQFVASGNAQAGLVARSQLSIDLAGAIWSVPPMLHEPIEQQAVLLVDTPAGRAFLEFLRSGAARDVIAGYGYLIDGTIAP